MQGVGKIARHGLLPRTLTCTLNSAQGPARLWPPLPCQQHPTLEHCDPPRDQI